MSDLPKPPPRILFVIDNQMVTPHMRRVTLGGPEMIDFPLGRESANFKLYLPQPGETQPLLPGMEDTQFPPRQPIVRTYTVRHYNAARREVDVDFFIHEDHGPATAWAIKAMPGDLVGFSYPSEPKPINKDAEWVLFAGDMTALPAIGANAEQLPSYMQGYAVLEIVDEADQQPLAFPSGIDVKWVVNPHPTRPNTILVDAVKKLPWLYGKPGVWVAGESGAIKELRHYFKQERGVLRDEIYISGYWQMGLNEDGHQKIKRIDAAY